MLVTRSSTEVSSSRVTMWLSRAFKFVELGVSAYSSSDLNTLGMKSSEMFSETSVNIVSNLGDAYFTSPG